MDREAGWATVHGVARVGHDVATKQQQFYILETNSFNGEEC